MRQLLLFSLLFFSIVLHGITVQEAVTTQMKRYPASTLMDLYKSFFQDRFGPGHLLSNGSEVEAQALNYIKRECEIEKQQPSQCLPIEQTGTEGRFYRVSLSLLVDGSVSPEQFLKVFLQSAKQFELPPIEEWTSEWNEIEHIIRKMHLHIPHYKRDARHIRRLLRHGQYAAHHSQEYNEAYHPHYRLIEKSLLPSLGLQAK